jgi:hypothetical protein
VPVGCDDDDSVTNFDSDGTNASIDAGVTELFVDAMNQKCDAIPDDTEASQETNHDGVVHTSDQHTKPIVRRRISEGKIDSFEPTERVIKLSVRSLDRRSTRPHVGSWLRTSSATPSPSTAAAGRYGSMSGGTLLAWRRRDKDDAA